MDISLSMSDFNFLTIITSIILAVITAKIAIYKDLRFIREARLRDRYWSYIKVLTSNDKTKDLKQQTYNLCLFAKNKQIVAIAKDFLNKKTITENDIQQIISLMRKDLGL